MDSFNINNHYIGFKTISICLITTMLILIYSNPALVKINLQSLKKSNISYYVIIYLYNNYKLKSKNTSIL
jgi:hypothetical protein